jgi:hypothetical protein
MKAMIRGKFIALSALMKKLVRCHTSDFTEKKKKRRRSKRGNNQEIIKPRAESIK